MWLLMLIPFCCASDTGGTGTFPYEEEFKTEKACRAAMEKMIQHLSQFNYEPGQKYQRGVNYDIKCVPLKPPPVS